MMGEWVGTLLWNLWMLETKLRAILHVRFILQGWRSRYSSATCVCARKREDEGGQVGVGCKGWTCDSGYTAWNERNEGAG